MQVKSPNKYKTDGKLTVHNVFIPQSFENGLLQISEAIRLMAAEAAKHIRSSLPHPPQIAFLVSCVGRRIVLAERVEEELEVIKNILGSETVLFGFYSYGEISPNKQKLGCELHNQTMTIATMYEA